MTDYALLPKVVSTLPALELAKLLCHKLARIEHAPAYVVNDNGHALVAVDLDFTTGYWTRDQVVFTAPAPE